METGQRFKVINFTCEVRCFSGKFRRLGLEKHVLLIFIVIFGFFVIFEKLFLGFFVFGLFYIVGGRLF